MKRLKLACLALFLTPLASFVGTAPAWGHDMPIDAAFACVGAGACEQSSQHDDADPFKGWIILTVENTGTEAWGDFHFELFQVTDPIDNVFFVVDSPEAIRGVMVAACWLVGTRATSSELSTCIL